MRETSLRDIDIRLGMISIVPSITVPPETMDAHLISHIHPSSIIHSPFLTIESNLDKTRVVHLSWKMIPPGIEEFVKHFRIYRSQNFGH